HRMVERCVAEFLPNIRMYKYAIEGDEIQPLPMRNIRKLKPGVYEEKRLRLIVDSTGKRTWIFRYRRRFTIHDMVLGGQEISFTKARELATMARRKLVAGLNPADGSWGGDGLQGVKLETCFRVKRIRRQARFPCSAGRKVCIQSKRNRRRRGI